MGIHDSMDMLGGKWKVYIIASLYRDSKRYSEILNDLKGISGKMLSRQLKEMEIDQLIVKKAKSDPPSSMFYELTSYGQTLKPVIHVLADWGIDHREKIFPAHVEPCKE
ncbi:MAG: transcriptional regulator [Flavobacterium sp.]|nr:MAG: transcriptional regulator [Flavobacterium sp.]